MTPIKFMTKVSEPKLLENYYSVENSCYNHGNSCHLKLEGKLRSLLTLELFYKISWWLVNFLPVILQHTNKHTDNQVKTDTLLRKVKDSHYKYL